MKKIVIMYPDEKGEHSKGDFGKNLLTFTKDFPKIKFQLNPIIYGYGGGNEKEIADLQVKLIEGGFEGASVYGGKGGLSSVLYRGYDWIEFTELSSTTIVRMDTNEHPISMIMDIATLAEKECCLAIFERELNHKNATPEEILANNQTFPLLYKAMTNGKVCLSNTHGFQSMKVETLRKIIPLIRQIRPDHDNWGMDAIIILAASIAQIGVIKHTYWLQEMKDGGKEKIEEKLQNHAQILMNARRFFV